MAIQTLKTIKKWFKTGSKPSQLQFWDVWDSFRHKSEKVPVADVEGIDELLAGINSITIYKHGALLIFKRDPNTNDYLESGDFVKGIVEGIFIDALFLGGDPLLLVNFNIINQIDF